MVMMLVGWMGREVVVEKVKVKVKVKIQIRV